MKEEYNGDFGGFLHGSQNNSQNEINIPSQMIHALKRVREELVFAPGNISIKPHGEALRELHGATYTSYVPTLLTNIRNSCGYDVLPNGTIHHYYGGIDGKEEKKQILIENQLQFLIWSYDGATRKNGKPAMVHPLQATEMVAGLLAPERIGDRIDVVSVVSTMDHDLIEDVEDAKNGMAKVKYRVEIGGKKREIGSVEKEDIFSTIKDFNGEYYGRKIVENLKRYTRPSIPEGMSKDDFYNHYLFGIYQKVRAALGKFGDYKSNSMSIWDIDDKKTRDITRLSLIPKGIAQMLSWKKIAVFPFQIGIYGFRELVDGTKWKGVDLELRAPESKDVESFRKGYSVAGPRKDERGKYRFELNSEVPESGAPILMFYRDDRSLEIEIPFCNNRRHALAIVKAGFGDASIRVEKKIVPWRLDRAMVFSIATDSAIPLESSAKKCVSAYDELLSSGELLSVFKDFNRRHRAQDAYEKWKGKMDSKRLEPFKLYKMKC